MDSEKQKILKLIDIHKDSVNELIKRLELIQSETAQDWEKNAAMDLINTELFPSIKNGYRLLNDLVWNYEHDITGSYRGKMKNYEIKHIKKELEQANELLIQNGICFSYKPPLAN